MSRASERASGRKAIRCPCECHRGDNKRARAPEYYKFSQKEKERGRETVKNEQRRINVFTMNCTQILLPTMPLLVTPLEPRKRNVARNLCPLFSGAGQRSREQRFNVIMSINPKSIINASLYHFPLCVEILVVSPSTHLRPAGGALTYRRQLFTRNQPLCWAPAKVDRHFPFCSCSSPGSGSICALSAEMINESNTTFY